MRRGKAEAGSPCWTLHSPAHQAIWQGGAHDSGEIDLSWVGVSAGWLVGIKLHGL